MMNQMRKHMKTVLWIVIGAFVATIFFVWGMDLNQQGKVSEMSSAAMVNKEPISYEDFGRVWEQRYRQVFTAANEEPKPDEVQKLRLEVINAMIDNVLMTQLFNKLGLKVFPEEVAGRISSISAFSQDGKFSQEKYLSLLGYNRVTPQEFEQQQDLEIRLIKIGQIIKDSVLLTESDIQNYFRAHTRLLKLQTVRFDWHDYLAGLQPSEEEIQTYYDEHKQEFDQAETVTASHILLRLPSNADDEAKLTAKLKLENIRADIVKGASFAAMAAKYSEDPGSKDKGGELGTFGKGQMVKPFEDAVFKLKPGELSNTVETDFGYHLIKVDAHQPARQFTLAEVKTKIIDQLKEKAARNLAQRAVIQFGQTVQAVKALAIAAQQAGKPLTVTPWLRDGDPLPQKPGTEKVVEQAFDLALQSPSRPLFAGDSIHFVQIVEEQNQPFNASLYALERDRLIEKAKNLRSNQVLSTWLQQARQEAKIINNIEKEKAEEEALDTTPSPSTAKP